MTRPLMNKTADELYAAVDRNKHDRAELLLIVQELRFRKTDKARAADAKAKHYLAELQRVPVTVAIGALPGDTSRGAADPGKYAKVHAAATAAGSPVMLGWKHAATVFVAGQGKHDATSVYGTIHAICREAGTAGITAAALATALRQRQTGNERSQYCDGVPPIGWAEGWIDTAVTRALIIARAVARDAPPKPARVTLPPLSAVPLVRAPEPSPPRAATPPSPPPPKAKPMTDARRWTEEAVAGLRTKLIDLSKKNPLISFKHGGRSASILRIVDERPDLLCAAIEKGAVGFEPLPGEEETPKDELTPRFRIAYERARLTDETFLAATEALGDDERDAKAWQQAERTLRAAVRLHLELPALDYGKTLDIAALAKSHGFDPSYDLKASDDGDVAAHHQDDRLRVLLAAKELDKRLQKIAEKYGTHKRETGLHTLFLVIGFVQWSEDATPDTALHAPLLLLDVELTRKPINGRYVSTLTAGEDGLQVNVALVEKMRQHWGLELPALRVDETPESYFIRVDAVLAKGRRLSLRRFATLAVLPFSRMVLWNDLDPAAWPEAAFADHRLLPGLLGASQIAGETSPGKTINIDAPEWAKIAPALIRPADASQHSALIDMAAGHDLAIEGPPGTGKSETITNMIATALAAGKKVLFVAEKQAALRVVADRLRASGFGALLLELHGDNANRADVYDGLRARKVAKTAHNPGVLASQRLQLDQQRTLLRRYLSLIDQPLGELGRTAYWLAWREIRLRASFERTIVEATAARWQAADARGTDQARLADRQDRLGTFGAALIALHGSASDGERTRWIQAGQLDPFDQRRQLDAASAAAQAAHAIHEAGVTIAAVGGVVMPGPGEPLAPAVDQLAALTAFEPVDEALVRATLRDPDTARALLRQQTRWRQLCGKLAADVASPGAVDAAALLTLAKAIGNVRPVPLTVSVARERLVATQAATAMAQAAEADRILLNDRLGLDPACAVEMTRTALEAVAAMAREPAMVVALYRSDLLDPLAEAALHSERLRAAALRGERDVLGTQVTDDALDADPAELSRVADVLSDSGTFARLVGGGYRAARRQAARLTSEPLERLAAADLLRRLARHHLQAAAFRRDSAVAGWFPAVLWKGADSDWDAIQRARAVLIDARARLSDARADATLGRWLAMSPDERTRVATAVGRVVPMLVKVAQAGFGTYPTGSVADALGTDGQVLKTLDAALAGVSANPDGEIVREGQDLAARLYALHMAASDFTALATQQEYGWVGGIGDPMEALARTLNHADALRAIGGPLAIVPALMESETPSSLLDRLIVASATWRQAERGWHEAASRLLEQASLTADTLGEDWKKLGQTLDALARDETGARLAADLQKYGRALDEAGLSALGKAALDGVAPPDRLGDLYELLLVRDLLRTYLGGDGAELGRTGGLTLARARETFAKLDKELHEWGRVRSWRSGCSTRHRAVSALGRSRTTPRWSYWITSWVCVGPGHRSATSCIARVPRCRR